MMTGPMDPHAGNNTNLTAQLMSCMTKLHSVCYLCAASTVHSGMRKTFAGAPVHWCAMNKSSSVRRQFYSAWTKLTDRNGYSDVLTSMLLRDEARELRKQFPCDALISTMEPFPAADGAARLRGVKKILYLMDPPACISGGKSTPYRDRRLKKILVAQDAILTTPFIRQALAEHGFGAFDNKIIPVGFPMIVQRDVQRRRQDDGRIHLLFCGWLYSDIRSPEYFLNILSRLDERFCVTFMGRECDMLTKRFQIQTKAELITMPQQPYEVALQAMADADILINIGNSVPVHMPSKTLEYINTGKPVVNFYKMQDCPTLYYTNRYPLCLNLSEQDPDLDAAADRFMSFCLLNKGKTVDRAYIESEYADCTPEYIAGKILEALEKNHG